MILKTRQLTDVTAPDILESIFEVDDGEKTAYGLATYTSPVSGKTYAFVSQRAGNQVAQVELAEMENQLDSLEEDLLDNALNKEFRSTLRRLRRQSIVLRRYIAPQSDVVSNLAYERVSWLTDLHRARLGELAQRNLRYVDDLGAMRERIIVIDEELSALTNEQINRTIFILSMVTAIFLPLSFITGLLGINVGGIPGATSESGFISVCIFLTFIVGLELFFFYHFLKKRQF